MIEPLVSIVLPTYNRAQYIDQLVDSCLAQTYARWELIIVDDGSTDDTPRKIAEYLKRDARIRTIRHGSNRKLPAALNTGFDAANGELFTWTSDDNLYRPDAIAETVQVLAAHPEVDCVYTDFSIIDHAGRLLQYFRVKDPVDLVHGNPLGQCAVYRSNVYLELGGYDESMFLAEDYDFYLRMAARYRLMPLHKDLYMFRMHSGTLTHLHAARVDEQLARALDRTLPYLPSTSDAERARNYARAADFFALCGRVDLARRRFLRALSLAPLTACLELRLGFLFRITCGAALTNRIKNALGRR